MIKQKVIYCEVFTKNLHFIICNQSAMSFKIPQHLLFICIFPFQERACKNEFHISSKSLKNTTIASHCFFYCTLEKCTGLKSTQKDRGISAVISKLSFILNRNLLFYKILICYLERSNQLPVLILREGQKNLIYIGILFS